MWDNAKRMLTAMPMRPRRQRQSAMLPWTGSPAFLYASHASTHFVKSFTCLLPSRLFQCLAVRVVESELGSVL